MPDRDDILAELGLTPVWRLRVHADVGDAHQRDSSAPDAPQAGSGPTAGGADAPSGSDARVMRIAKIEWPAFATDVDACTACGLCRGRRKSVPGVGDPHAEWLFVGEAPGAEEDARGEPFVGQAGKLLDSMLAALGMKRGENVYIANVLKCRPPGNRDPLPDEIEACQGYLYHQIQLIRPSVICTLGNFSTKLLSGNPAGITRVRGRPQPHTFGEVSVQLYPIYHPAAALYTPAMLEMLRDDFSRLPELLRAGPAASPIPETAPDPAPAVVEPADAQMSFQF